MIRVFLLLQGSAWISAIACAVGGLGANAWLILAAIGLLSLVVTTAWLHRSEDQLIREMIDYATSRVSGIRDPGGVPVSAEDSEEWAPFLEELKRLDRLEGSNFGPGPKDVRPAFSLGDSVEMDLRKPYVDSLTRSGMFAPALLEDASGLDERHLGPSTEIVNRLDPRTLRWLDSSRAEQEFLGWTVDELRQRSYLEIIHPDDRDLAREQIRTALTKGEAHGLIYRIKTARGESKAIEMYVGVRYGSDRRITHLRCHLRDVTAKVKASKELRRRTRELTLVNQELRRANRELQELKDLYRDLYQNAPVIYFSIDPQAHIIECNDTMLEILGYRRDELVGQPYIRLLTPTMQSAFPTRFASFLETGSLEVESVWLKADGTRLNVWITASAVRNDDGSIRHSRSIGVDVTAQRALEAQLREKNDLLAEANEELSAKIRELDEFSYVVSHDLQEPIRTLIAFSDFLMKDCADRLDETGREYVRYLVDASRRMRSMIQDLLSLSRAGKVTAEFSPVNLEEVLAVVKSDLSELTRTRSAELRVIGPFPSVWGDKDRLGQLFTNLVGNGLKYNTNDRPEVQVGVSEESTDGHVVLYVRDNGIGIEPQFHTRIFQLFRRLHTREEFEGTGAGLAICQKIVQAHDGQLWVESELGKGSTFFIKLPTRRPQPSTPRPDNPDDR